MWLTRYAKSIEITYGEGSEIICYEFIRSLIETEYGIRFKPSTLQNPSTHAISERIH